MARTRSNKAGATSSTTRRSKKDKSASSSSSTTTTTAAASSRYTLAPEPDNPPRLFILPKNAAPDARIVTIQHPRHAKPTRYLACPQTGIYEFTRIAAPKSSPRSWLVERQKEDSSNANGSSGSNASDFPVQVAGDNADLYVASPIDPLFLVLPALAAPSSEQAKKRMFLSSDDHLDTMLEKEKEKDVHLAAVLRWPGLRARLEARMAAVCDTVEAGDEPMFRLSEAKLVAAVLEKARRMAGAGLPRSMEERFVAKVLEAPIMSVRSQAALSSSTTIITTTTISSSSLPEENGSSTPAQTDSVESQSSASSISTTPMTEASQASTAATSISTSTSASITQSTTTTVEAEAEVEVVRALQAPPEIVSLQRLRVALDFIYASYIPVPLATQIQTHIGATATSGVDFAPLDAYLAQLAKLKQDAAAARTGDYSRKRGADGEEEADERAEKKRKKEEEEKKKKAGASRAVKELRKVNTSGMKKLSEFFKKK